jgi:putative membrane protein
MPDLLLRDAVLAYLHYAALIATASLLVAEAAVLRAAPAALPVRLLGRLDGAYGAAAVLAVVTGFSRAIWGAKGWDFYAANPFFHAKIGTFVLVALLSIVPTVQVIRWGRGVRADAAFAPPADAVGRVRRWVWIELALLALIPLLAVLMRP